MQDSADHYTVTAADFESRVLTESGARPVVVDFWAAWCGPCRSIAPLLEDLARRFAGALAVAKVDTDAEQVLAGRYGIRSLPTLVLFRHGAPVEQLVGAHPLQALIDLVTRHLDRASDAARRAAAAARARGELAEARRLLDAALVADPDNMKLHPELAEVLVELDELRLASEILENVPTRDQDEAYAQVAARVRVASLAQAAAPLATLDAAVRAGTADLDTRFHWAVRQATRGEHAAALAALLAIVREDRRYGDDAARRAILDVFTLMPPGDPAIREYRALLARALN
jgi:putative thioredoxin